MAHTWKDPAEATTSLPGLENRLSGQIQNSKSAPVIEAFAAPWPVRLLARRHGLPLPTARTIAILASLAGAA